MFYHIAWITIGTKTSLTSRERILLNVLLRGHVFFFFFLTASGKYQSNNENNEWFVGWHLIFLYYALFFWASTYHYVLSYRLNHCRNEYFIDVKEKEFSWVFYWGVMFFFLTALGKYQSNNENNEWFVETCVGLSIFWTSVTVSETETHVPNGKWCP